MTKILHIETSGKACSVAVSSNRELVVARRIDEERSHASSLTLLIDDLLKEAGYNIHEINAVAVSEGPGSYTGLRIGVSVAKGICYGANIPLLAIPTLEIIYQDAMKKLDGDVNKDAVFIPMIDARRMEVYETILDANRQTKRETAATIIDENSFSEWLLQGSVYYFGDGAEKCQEALNHQNANYIADVVTDAANMVDLAMDRFEENKFEDIAYYEPFYLKEFQATVAKNSVLDQIRKK